MVRHDVCRPDISLVTRARAMFAIDWLRRAVPVERETSVLSNVEHAVVAAKARADAIAARHRGEEPDSSRSRAWPSGVL
jgi:hypothetical protein